MAAQLTLQQSGSALSSVCPCMARAQARGQAARPAEVAKDSYRNLFVTPLPLQILKFLVEDYAEAARNLEEYINEACDEIAYGPLCGDGFANEEFDDLCEEQDEVVSVLHTHDMRGGIAADIEGCPHCRPRSGMATQGVV